MKSIKLYLKLFLVLILPVCLCSCRPVGKSDTYHIIGESSQSFKGKAILAKLDLVTNKKQIVDSANIVRGRFSFKGSVETPYLHSIFINDIKTGINFFLENSLIEIDFDTTKLDIPVIKGSREDSLFRRYSLDEIFEKKAGMEIMTKFPEYTFSAFTAYYQFQINEFTRDTMETILNNFSIEVKRSAYYEHLVKLYESIKLSAPGEKAPNFKIKNQAGSEIELTDFHGKYLMLDFWASWCAPCRAENPKILEVYNRFKNTNFTILSVSVDESKENWIKAINDDQINDWNHASNLEGWDEISKLYGVRAIPQNFLIDPDGIIIAKNISMEELNAILENSKSSVKSLD